MVNAVLAVRSEEIFLPDFGVDAASDTDHPQKFVDIVAGVPARVLDTGQRVLNSCSRSLVCSIQQGEDTIAKVKGIVI